MHHPSFYPQSQPSFQCNRRINSFYRSYYPDSVRNHSSQNLNFKAFPMAFNGWNQQRCRPNLPRTQQPSRPTPAFYFQDKSTFYYMSDPMTTQNNRIAIQLTKVHIGPNGDQQRVYVEQEFSNRTELKKFVKNLQHNFEKTFNNPAADNLEANSKKPGTIVVEEPDEEPKVYEEQVYNEKIQSKQSLPVNHSKYPRSTAFASSCSTVRSNRYRRNKIKYQRQKINNQGQHPTAGKLPSDAPFQQRFWNRPNAFHFHTQVRRNENHRPSTTMPRPVRPKDQLPSQFGRVQQQQQLNNQPTTIKNNLFFKTNAEQQPRVQSMRSEYRSDCLPNGNQRQFTPLLAPSLAPDKRGIRNIPVHFRLFNPYRAN